MAIIPCPNCGKPISDKSTQCPKCGHKMNHEKETEEKNSIIVSDEKEEQEEIVKSCTKEENENKVVIGSIEIDKVEEENNKTEIPTILSDTTKQEIKIAEDKPQISDKTEEKEDLLFSREVEKEVLQSPEEVNLSIPKKKKKGLTIFLLLLILILAGGGFFWWFYYENVYLPEKIDREAPRTYPIVNVFLRSSKMAGGDFNKLATVPYGAELITYDEDGEWAKVKYISPDPNSKPIEGYVASEYLLNKKELYIVNTMFGDNDSREVLATAKVRRGLLDYFINNQISGRISPELAAEVTLTSDPSRQWLVIFHRGQTKPNEVLFKRAFDKESKFTDMAVILENISTGEKKLLYFTYDEDETPHLRGEKNYSSDAIKDFFITDYDELTIIDEKGNRDYMKISR